MASRYGTDKGFSLMPIHLVALPFIPSDEIAETFNVLKPDWPTEGNDLIE